MPFLSQIHPRNWRFTVNYHIKNIIDTDISFLNCMYPLKCSLSRCKSYKSTLYSWKWKQVHQNVLQNNIRFIKYKVILKMCHFWSRQESNHRRILKSFLKTQPKEPQRERMLKINDFEYVKVQLQHQPMKPNSKTLLKPIIGIKVRYYVTI
jgi:hypothetical protein